MRKKVLRGIGLVLLVLVLGVGLWAGPTLVSVWRAGFFERIEPEEFRVSRENNLRALHTALILYHDSEGQFPAGNGWMEAIRPRLARNGLSMEEAQIKLIRPDLAGNANQYGYALNEAAIAKYKDDIPGDDPVLVFESETTERDAVGKPEPSPERWGITVSGQIVPAASSATTPNPGGR